MNCPYPGFVLLAGGSNRFVKYYRLGKRTLAIHLNHAERRGFISSSFFLARTNVVIRLWRLGCDNVNYITIDPKS
jgi:hypothetical protein